MAGDKLDTMSASYDYDYSKDMFETIIDWIILVEDSQNAFERIQVCSGVFIKIETIYGVDHNLKRKSVLMNEIQTTFLPEN